MNILERAIIATSVESAAAQIRSGLQITCSTATEIFLSQHAADWPRLPRESRARLLSIWLKHETWLAADSAPSAQLQLVA